MKTNMSTHAAKPTDEENKEEQGAVPLNIQEELPEVGQLSFTSEILGALAFIPLGNRLTLSSAFERMNQKDFELKVQEYLQNPDMLDELVHQRNMVKKGIDRHIQQEVDQKKPLPSSTTVGFWRFRQSIDHAVFDHRSRAVDVLQAIQKKVNTDERNIRITNAAKQYGLDPRHTDTFVQSYDEWSKKNPRASMEDYLHGQGAELYKKQTGKELSKKDQIYIRQSVTKANENARKNALQINTQNGYLARGNTLINQMLDTTQPLLTPDQLKQRIMEMVDGPKAKPEEQVAPVTTYQQTPQPSAPNNRSNNDRNNRPPPPPISSLPSRRFFPSGFQSVFPNFSNRLPSIAARFGPVGNFLSGGLGGLAKTGLSNLASKAITNTALKAGVNALLGAATGGLSTAATAINEVVKQLSGGVDVLGLTAKGVVLAIAGVVLLFFFLFTGSVDSIVPGQTITVKPSQVGHVPIGWSEFEQRFLSADSDSHQASNAPWDQFETRHLLSLEPTTHN